MSSQYKLKRCLAGILAAMIAVSAFSGCSDSSDSRRDDTEECETEDKDNERDEDKENDSFSGGIFGNNGTSSHVELGSGAGEYLPVDTPPEEVIDEGNEVGNDQPVVEIPEYEYPDIWEVLPYIDETPANRFEYEYDEEKDGIVITAYLGSSTEIRIPDTIDGKPVVSADLGDIEVTQLIMPKTLCKLSCNREKIKYANFPSDKLYNIFDSNHLEKLYIESSVTSISGFNNCAVLDYIAIPDTVVEIGYSAFSGCTALTSIILPDSVATVGDEAFSGCSGISLLYLPESVTTIGKDAFKGCNSLKKVLLPDSLVSIGTGAFTPAIDYTVPGVSISVIYKGKTYTWNNSGVMSTSNYSDQYKLYDAINYPDVYVVEDGVLKHCAVTYEGEFVIPDGVTTIGEDAFAACYMLTDVKIPDSVTSISPRAFQNCYKLTSVTIPNSVTEILAEAFNGCDKLETVVLSDSLTYIGSKAFYDCHELVSITIPDSVIEIGDKVFDECDKLTEIIYKNKFYSYQSLDKLYDAIDYSDGYTIYYNDQGSTVIGGLDTYEGELNIDDSIYAIGDNAFEGCTKLTSIIIPDNVKRIGVGAFRKCYGLMSVTIGNGVTKIERGAFSYCTNLTTVNIGNGVTEICVDAFYGCKNLTSIIIPDSVTKIVEPFGGCDNLSSIFYKGKTYSSENLYELFNDINNG